MAIINVESSHGLTRIETIKNPFTEKYIERYKESLTHYPVIARPQIFGIWFGQPSGEFIKQQHQKLTDVINELNDMGTDFPYECSLEVLERRDTEAQMLLNRLHRAFTTAQRSSGEDQRIWSDRFPSAFTVPSNKEDRFRYLIEQINELVHQTETWCNTERKSVGANPSGVSRFSFKKTNVRQLPHQVEFYTNFFTNNGTRLPHENFFLFEQDDYKYFSDSREFDVWVGKDILGKDYLVAYFEHDDAGEWDVTHSLGHTAKFAVDIFERKRADYINSDEFRAWLAEGGVEYTPAMCGMPLGHVIEGHDLLEKHYNTSLPWDNVRITIE